MGTVASVPEGDSLFPKKISKRPTWLSIILGVVLIILGALAILLPVEMSIGVVIVVCWLLIIGAVVQIIDAFRGSGAWQTIWKILVAAAYLVTGLYLRFHLGIGLVALTLTLILFFAFQGLTDVLLYFRVRKAGASGWLLGHGIITLILTFMIWRHWPSGSAWVLGTLVGINMMITGVTRLMLTFAVRRAAKMVVEAT